MTKPGEKYGLGALRQREERERNQESEERRLRIKRTWPQVTAAFDSTLVGEMTLKSGDQIFTDEVKERTREYWHYYKYVVDSRTYNACLTTNNPEPEKTIVVRYRAKDPAEYLID